MHSLPVRRAEPSARGLKGCRPLGCRVCHDQRLLAEARGAEDALVCRSTREPPPHVHRQGRGILAPDRGVRSLRDAARFPMKKPRGNGWSWRGATSRNQAGRCRTGKKPSTASLFRGEARFPRKAWSPERKCQQTRLHKLLDTTMSKIFDALGHFSRASFRATRKRRNRC